MKLKPYIYIILPIILGGCSNHKENNQTIPEDIFVNLYADVQIAREESNIMGTDSTAMKHKADSLYDAYHVSAKEVESALEVYKYDLPRWKLFHQKVIQRLESLQKLTAGDTTDTPARPFK